MTRVYRTTASSAAHIADAFRFIVPCICNYKAMKAPRKIKVKMKGLQKHDYKKKNCAPQLNKRQNSIKSARKLTAGEKIRNMAHKTDKHWQTITS